MVDALKQFQHIQVPSGSIIIDSDSAAKTLLYLLSGTASLELYTVSGRQGAYLLFHSGDFLGEVEMLTGIHFPASAVVARSDCEVLTASFETARELLRQDLDFANLLLYNMAQKMLMADRERVLQNTATVRERLLVALKKHSEDGSLGEFCKERMAAELCTPIRSLNRAIVSIGEVACYRKGFIIKDSDALTRYTQDILLHTDSGIEKVPKNPHNALMTLVEADKRPKPSK